MITLNYTLQGCNRSYAGNPSLSLIGGAKPQSIELDEVVIKTFQQDLANLSAQNLLVYEVIKVAQEATEAEAEVELEATEAEEVELEATEAEEVELEATEAEEVAQEELEDEQVEVAQEELEVEAEESEATKGKSKGKK